MREFPLPVMDMPVCVLGSALYVGTKMHKFLLPVMDMQVRVLGSVRILAHARTCTVIYIF